MNSPETPVYSKSETLYGLYAAREALRKARFAVLVEGYLDFASLFEAGIENVVASLGTALTEGHARLLARLVDCVIVNYDADDAGKTASLRSLHPLVAKGLRIRILRLPAGEDPDLCVRRIGRDAYLAMLDAAPDAMDYAIDAAICGKDLASARTKVLALNEVLPLLAAIESPIERARYVPVLADRLAVEDSLILAEIGKAVKQGRASVPLPPVVARDEARASLAESGLIRVLLEVPGATQDLVGLLPEDLLAGLPTRGILTAIREMDRDGEPIDYPSLSGRLDEGSRSLLGRIAMSTDPLGDLDYARGCIHTLELDRLQAECRRIQRRIDASTDSSLHAVLATKKFELSQRIRDLS